MELFYENEWMGRVNMYGGGGVRKSQTFKHHSGKEIEKQDVVW